MYATPKIYIKRLFPLLILLLSALYSAPLNAAPTTLTFIVNGSGDQSDADLNDDLCDVNLGAAGEQCSLRAAIEQANASAGADNIRFGNAQRTISPTSALPTITEQVTINGVNGNDATCPTATTAANLLITLDGSNTTATSGLLVSSSAANSVIKGLAIVNWLGQPGNGSGITNQADGTRIECNHIGIAADGTTPAPNTYGVVAAGDNVVIGGPDSADRNVISGNTAWGIALSTGHVEIYNNYIGTDAAGTSGVDNGTGIRGSVNGGSTGTAIVGAAGQGNVIAFNGTGIDANFSTMTIRYNSMFSNVGRALDTGLSTDFEYVDNTGQVIIDFSSYSSSFPATIDLYGNAECDPVNGEGKEHFASFNVGAATDTVSEWLNVGAFNAPFAAFTITNADGKTLGFSNCIAVEPAFRVNGTGDLPDLTPGDGRCDVQANAGDQCSLRAAFEEINAQGIVTPTVLRFDIALPATIAPTSALPNLTSPVVIDLSAETNTDCPEEFDDTSSVVLQIDGTNAGAGSSGITLLNGADNSTLAGFSVTNFDEDGIRVRSDNTTISCVHVGVLRDGMTAGGNGRNGISTTSGDGLMVRQSVITENGGDGINATTSGAITIEESFIGVNADYGLKNGNGGHGIFGSSEMTVRESIIGQNQSNGIAASGAVTLEDNYIGLSRLDDLNIGNRAHGIALANSSQTSTIFDNVIAYNVGAGIALLSSRTNVKIDQNSIYDNGGLGIDLNNDGVTPNDVIPDADSGANGLQNYPVILGTNGATGAITVSLESSANGTFQIDFFDNDDCDPSGFGEGKRWLSTFEIMTNASGMVTAVLSPTNFVVNDYLSATATRFNNTSEFSACYHAVERFTVNTTGDEPDADPNDQLCLTAIGTCTLRAAIEQANALFQSRRIEFASDGMVIMPQTPLPFILKPITIDGSPQTTRAIDTPLTTIDGSSLASGDLLRLGAGSDGSTLQGLQLINSPGSGLVIDSNGNSVSGNIIGTDAFSADLGNAADGITINGDDNAIANNIIAHNTDDGIAISSGGNGNTLSGNSIDQNGNLGIDLNDNGVSNNDAGDGDGGANRLQNFPELGSATMSSVTGTLNSQPNRNYRIELFGVETCDDPFNHGEGRVYLGATTATTNGSGDAAFAVSADVCTNYAVATATNLTTGDTSEFSACLLVNPTTPTAVGLQSSVIAASARTAVAIGLLVTLLIATLLTLRSRRHLAALMLLSALLLTVGAGQLTAQSDGRAVTASAPPVLCDDLFISDGTLTNGGSVEDESGVFVATVTNTLSSSVEFMIESLDVHDPTYDGSGTMVGSYYQITPSSDIATPFTDPLIIGIPVPAGSDGNDILVGVYTTDGVRDSAGTTPWGLTTTYYDADDNVMLISAVRMGRDGVVVTLAESADFDPLLPPTSRTSNNSLTVNVEPICLVPCLPATRNAFAAEFEAAYNDFVGTHGFNDPVLPDFYISVTGGQNDPWVPDINYVNNTFFGVVLKPAFLCDGYAGIYRPDWPLIEICSISTPISADVRDTIRHEFFHAITQSYPSMTIGADDDQEWVWEGAATIAGASIGGIDRSDKWSVRNTSESLLQLYSVDSGLLAYEGQDFWFYTLDENGLPLSYLETILQGGAEATDVNSTVGNLPDLYFEWARNHVYEHHNDNDGHLPHVCNNDGILNTVVSNWISDQIDDEEFEVIQTITLDPLSSGWVIFDIAPDVNSQVEATVNESGGGAASHYKVYSKLTDGNNCQAVADGVRQFSSLSAGDVVGVLVSNPSFTAAKSFDVKLTIDAGR